MCCDEEIVSFFPSTYFEPTWWARLSAVLPPRVQNMLFVIPSLHIKCGLKNTKITWLAVYEKSTLYQPPTVYFLYGDRRNVERRLGGCGWETVVFFDDDCNEFEAAVHGDLAAYSTTTESIDECDQDEGDKKDVRGEVDIG